MRTIALSSLLLGLSFIFIVNTSFGKKPGNDKGKFAVGARPFVFLENKGQLIDQFNKHRTDIDYKLAVPGMNIAIGAGLIQYQWNKLVKAGRDDENSRSYLDIYSLDVFLEGANENAEIVAEKPAKYYENYYLPQCPDGATAHTFEKVTYKNIYPKIDWVLYTVNNTLKYDFIVHPGGKVNDIKLRYSGDSMLKMHNGSLTAYTPYGDVTENAPYAYQINSTEGKDVRKDVPVKFVLRDKNLAFETGSYDGTLVIDPTVRWSGYFGGSNNDNAFAVTCEYEFDVTFKVFMAGNTISYNIVSTPGAHQSQNAEPFMNSGLEDGYIAAFNQNGGHEWITYYGGNDKDEFRSMVCDKNGDIYLAGSTRSNSGISTPLASQPLMGGGGTVPTTQYLDGMLVKFNAAGVRQWGTYVGGSHWDRIWGMGVDLSNNVYVTGETYSPDKIATPGSYRQTNSSSYKDAFLIKYSSSGSKLWGTYYGGDKDDFGMAVVCDRNGNVYLGGHTKDDTCGHAADPSKDSAMATPGAFKYKPANMLVASMCPPPPTPGPVPPPPLTDGFLVKFNSSGNRQWGTYYGGTNDDLIYCLAYDSTIFVAPNGQSTDGIVYIGGVTSSGSDIATPTGVQSTKAPNTFEDGFVAAFLPSGERYWATYIESSGPGNDRVNAMDVDIYGALIVSGEAGGNGLATPDAYRLAKTGTGGDAFVAIFNQAAKVYCTYLGGNGGDAAYAHAINDANHIYVAGNTFSSDVAYHYINTNALHGPAHHGTPNSDLDAFLTRVDIEMTPVICVFEDMFPMSECPGGQYNHPVKFLPPNQNPIIPGNTYTIQLSDANGSFVNATTIGSGAPSPAWKIPINTPPGQYKIRAIGTKPLFISQPQPVVVEKIPYPVITSSNIGCEGDTMWLKASDTVTNGTLSYKWVKIGGTFTSFSRDTFILNADTSHKGKYVIMATINNSCTATDTVDIIVNPKPAKPSATNNTPICAGATLELMSDADTAGGYTTVWTGPNAVFNTPDVSIVSAEESRTGIYTITVTKNGCSNFDTTHVTVAPQPSVVSISSNSPVCFNDTVTIFSTLTPPTAVYTWTGPNGFTSTSLNPVLLEGKLEMNGYYKVEAVLGNCKDADSTLVTVMQLIPTPQITTNSPVKEGDELKFNVADMAGATFKWTGPNGFTSTDQSPAIPNVTTKAAGTYTLTATIDGCDAVTTVIIVVLEDKSKKDESIGLYPNPTEGTFTLKTYVKEDQTIPIEVVNAGGQMVYQQTLKTQNKLLQEVIKLPGGLAAGIYQLRIRKDGKMQTLPFSLKK